MVWYLGEVEFDVFCLHSLDTTSLFFYAVLDFGWLKKNLAKEFGINERSHRVIFMAKIDRDFYTRREILQSME